MERTYSLNDLSQMTGLTTRTLRNYIRMEFLQGEKEDGIWRFTPEAYTEFLSHPNVQPVLRAKQQGIVYDFLAEKKRGGPKACLILDDAEEVRIEEVLTQVNALKEEEEDLCFRLDQRGRYRRMILTAAPETCEAFLKAYGEWAKGINYAPENCSGACSILQ